MALIPEVKENINYHAMFTALVNSNNDQERRLQALEPAQQALKLEPAAESTFCTCKEPFSYLGGKNCLTCAKLIASVTA